MGDEVTSGYRGKTLMDRCTAMTRRGSQRAKTNHDRVGDQRGHADHNDPGGHVVRLTSDLVTASARKDRVVASFGTKKRIENKTNQPRNTVDLLVHEIDIEMTELCDVMSDVISDVISRDGSVVIRELSSPDEETTLMSGGCRGCPETPCVACRHSDVT